MYNLTYSYKKAFTTITTMVVICSVLAACNRKAEEPKSQKFVLSDSILKHLLVDTVQQANALAQITLTGKITPDEDKMVKIFPMVSGIVRDVHVQLGDVIKPGQLLATMKSVEMAAFAKDAVAAQADIRNSRRNLQVTEDLYKSGMASQKDLEQAKGDYSKAQAEEKRTKAVMQINKSNANMGYLIKSPIGGFVVEKKLTNNMQVRADNTDNMFTIADLSSVWAMVNVYESDIAKIKTGDDVKITTLSYPDKVFSGKIDKIYSMLDPDNKVMRARVKINNPGLLLKPEMFANVKVKAVSGENLPVINTRSLIFDNDRNYVIVLDDKKQPHIQPVVIAKKIEDRAYISNGLKAGDHVIASRQVFVYESLK